MCAGVAGVGAIYICVCMCTYILTYTYVYMCAGIAGVGAEKEAAQWLESAMEGNDIYT